jgi:hypothetical protein
LASSATNRREIAAAIAESIAFGKAQNVTEVWAVLDTPAAIEMAMPVAVGLGVPLKAMVWDDIEHNTRYFGLDRLTAWRCRSAFDAVIAHASRLAVIGESMREEYLRRYRKHGVIVRHGADTPPTALQSLHNETEIRIGFAGSVTARSAFECLLAALDELKWTIGDRPITLVLMGGRFDLWSRVPRRIECLGWRTVDETIEILSQCTLNYLPQPFEPDWRPFSQLSFPSKLTTYLAARAPILLHAPAGSSLPKFFARYPFGEIRDQLEPSQLGRAIETLACDQSVRATALAASGRALAEEFTTARFRDSFAEFLGSELNA